MGAPLPAPGWRANGSKADTQTGTCIPPFRGCVMQSKSRPFEPVSSEKGGIITQHLADIITRLKEIRSMKVMCKL